MPLLLPPCPTRARAHDPNLVNEVISDNGESGDLRDLQQHANTELAAAGIVVPRDKKLGRIYRAVRPNDKKLRFI